MAWKDMPCPLHPSWGLQDVSDLDHAKLKQRIDTDENDEMVIERHIYRAFLECPIQQGVLYNQKPRRPSEALGYLKKAEKCVKDLCSSENARIGYGIVINTFRMWITTEPYKVKEYETNLNTLSSNKDKYPDHEVYINVVHAYILSRLGPRWSDKALSLYCKAVERFPKNYEWMLGKALIIERKARRQMEITDWKYPLPKDVVSQFEEEKTILGNILKLKPNFHHARALYGNVCFNLKTECDRAEEEMAKALKDDPENQAICILVAKFYRRRKRYLEAEELLQGLARRVEQAVEVHCQLGCLYRAWAPRSDKRDTKRFRERALHHFSRATELDSCHYPSICGKAEMEKMLNRKRQACQLFMDLFEGTFKDKPHLVLEEYSCLKRAIHIDVFTPLQLLKLLHRFIWLTVNLPHICSFTTDLDPSLVQEHVNRCFHKFQKMIGNGNEETKREAKLKFANVNLLLKKDMERTTKLHKDLIEEFKGSPEENELSYGLGKCYTIMGEQAMERDDEEEANTLWGSATQVADRLQQLNAASLANELYADIHLLKAKTLLRKSIKGENNLTEYVNELKLAITMGSLEACHIYISTIKDLNEKFFSEENVPETLAGVQLVCDDDSPLHTTFIVRHSHGPDIIYNVPSKREFIRNMVEGITSQEISFAQDSAGEKLSTLVTQLRGIRQTRFEYEVELIKSKRNQEWGDDYKDKLLNLLHVTRNTLDNCIAVCQKLLLENPPNNSMFLICFDWKRGQINQAKCCSEVNKWAKKKTFPLTSLPDCFLNKIVKVQPMFHEENMWLAALGSFINLAKHNLSGLRVGETFPLTLTDGSVYRTMKTDDIARRSCNEVVTLVKYLVQCLLPPPNKDEGVSSKKTNLTEVSHAVEEIENLSLTSQGKDDGVTK